MTDANRPARRRRRRATSAQGPAPAPVAATPPVEDPEVVEDPVAGAAPKPVESRRPARAAPADGARKRRASREPGERGLRDIVGAGNSQLGVSGALRGRDVNRPTDEDLAEAERDVVIVRRNWKPDGRR